MKETNFSEYKNFMDEDFITYLSNYYLINVLHRYGHTSRRGTGGKTFFATEVDHDVVSNFVTYKLRKKFGVNQFNRIYINLQFNGMGGDWHLDDGKKTYMLMVTPTLKKVTEELKSKNIASTEKKLPSSPQKSDPDSTS